jgi:serine/threonine protein kinase
VQLENVMLNSRKEIVVIDLGLGNFMKADELLSTFCGSTAYAAPEMFLCQARAPSALLPPPPAHHFSSFFRVRRVRRVSCPVVLEQDYVGSHVDIWSMGVMLFCLVLGFLPFEDPQRIVQADFVPFSEAEEDGIFVSDGTIADATPHTPHALTTPSLHPRAFLFVTTDHMCPPACQQSLRT